MFSKFSLGFPFIHFGKSYLLLTLCCNTSVTLCSKYYQIALPLLSSSTYEWACCICTLIIKISVRKMHNFHHFIMNSMIIPALGNRKHFPWLFHVTIYFSMLHVHRNTAMYASGYTYLQVTTAIQTLFMMFVHTLKW